MGETGRASRGDVMPGSKDAGAGKMARRANAMGLTGLVAQ